MSTETKNAGDGPAERRVMQEQQKPSKRAYGKVTDMAPQYLQMMMLGKSLVEIGRHFGVGDAAVRTSLKKAGMPTSARILAAEMHDEFKAKGTDFLRAENLALAQKNLALELENKGLKAKLRKLSAELAELAA